MGCGASFNENKDNDFYYECDSEDETNNQPELKNNSKTYSIHRSGNYIFYRENYKINQEESVSRPWMNQIVEFKSFKIKKQTATTSYILKPDHIFGFSIDKIRNNLFAMQNEQILYASGCSAIIESISDKSQTIFGCDERSSSNKLCHNNSITAIDYLNGDVSMVVTGQKGLRPTVLIWSPVNTSTIYGKYNQIKGSKKVAGISIDEKGRYVVSYGRDENNTFYVYDVQLQEIVATVETGMMKILGIKYGYKSEDGNNDDEICVCGYKLLFFFNVNRHLNKGFGGKDPKTELIDKHNINKIFTCCNCFHTNESGQKNYHWLVGSYDGDIYYYYKKELVKQYSSMTEGSVITIQNFPFSNMIYASDGKKYLYYIKYDAKKEKLSFKVEKEEEYESIVKGIAMNSSGDMFLSLKNGKIQRIFNSGAKQIKNENLVATHIGGGVFGVDIVDNKRIVTVGEDNRVIVWNLNSFKCESIGKIHDEEVELEKGDDSNNLVYKFNKWNMAHSVSVNLQSGHIAIGILNGNVSIRESSSKLDQRVGDDISIGRDEITVLKYCQNGNLLAVANKDGEFEILDGNKNYQMVKSILLTTGIYITELDWNKTNEFIQFINNKSQYDVFHIEFTDSKDDKKTLPNLKEMKTVPQDYEKLLKSEWNKITCKFGYFVQGIFMGSNDSNFISTCCKADNKNLICTGDDDCCLNLLNYPVINENYKPRRYYAHADSINRIVFACDDTKVVTIGGKDNTIISWKVKQIS